MMEMRGQAVKTRKETQAKYASSPLPPKPLPPKLSAALLSAEWLLASEQELAQAVL